MVLPFVAGESAKQLNVFFPGFSSSKLMYFLVDQRGSTYYMDAEHDGLWDPAREALSAQEALSERHLARLAGEGGDVLRAGADQVSADGRLEVPPAVDLAEERHLQPRRVGVVVIVGVWR